MPRLPLSRSLAMLLVAAAASPAQAFVYCANNATELRSAFSLVGSNGQDDEIRIRATAMPASGAMLSGETYYASLVDGGDLLISGGWTDVFCENRGEDAKATVLTALGTRGLIRIDAPAQAVAGDIPQIAVSNLQLVGNGQTAAAGCALQTSGQHHLDLERAVVRDFDCPFTAPVTNTTNAGTLAVRNNLFAFNRSAGASVLRNFGSNGTRPAVTIVANNTVVGNVSTQSRFAIETESLTTFHIENNVFWDNVYPDSDPMLRYEIDSSGATVVRNNVIEAPNASFSAQNGNLRIDPQFVAVDDLRPRRDSPLRNRGTNQPFGGIEQHDLDGQLRPQEATMDIGAFEVDVLFADDFE